MEMIANKADWIAIPPTTSRAWVDYDLNNAGCPANTIGVICYMLREESGFGDAYQRGGIRPNGSTDDGSWIWYAHTDGNIPWEKHQMQICGCDANKIIEVYYSSSADLGNSRMYIIGWIQTGDAHLLTNCVDANYHSGPSTGSWAEIDFDAALQGGDTPQAWIIKNSNMHWNNDDYQSRPKGSGWGRRSHFQYETQIDRICGVGTQNRVEVYIGDSSNQKVSTRGYWLSGYNELYSVAADYNTGVDDTWTWVDLSAWVPEGAYAIFENDSSASSSLIGVRTEGDTSTRRANIGPGPTNHIVSVGDNQRVQVSLRYQRAHFVSGYIEGGPTEHNLTTTALHGDHQVQGKGVVQPAAIAPTYQNMTFYFDEPIDPPIDLSEGWVNANPDDFAALNLPWGLSVSPQGILTGTPTCPPLELAPASMSNTGVLQIAAVDTEHHLVIADGYDLGNGGIIQDGEIGYTPPVTYELTFNNSRIDTGVVLDPNSEYTIECTIIPSVSGNHRGIFGCDTPTMMLQNRDTNYLRIRHWETKEGDMFDATTQDGVETLVRLHLPGSSGDATGTTIPGGSGTRARGGTTSNSRPLIIGRAGDLASSNYFRGVIKDFKLWTGNKGTLIHHWPINDNSNTIADIVGTSDGTLTITDGSWNQV